MFFTICLELLSLNDFLLLLFDIPLTKPYNQTRARLDTFCENHTFHITQRIIPIMQQASTHRPDEPLPEAREVAANIWKITEPIPFPLRTVNMYALIGQDGWALVDTGMGNPDAREALSAGLRKAGLSIDTLKVIVLSHHHPDHVGLSGELQEQSGALVYMHPIDEEAMQFGFGGKMPDRFKNVSHFFLQHGLPQSDLWFTKVEPDVMRNIIRVPPHKAFQLVEDGEHINILGEDYLVIWTPGHSDGQICLFRARDGVFLAADHVLPRITPNIGLYSHYDRPNPLQDYLDSLAKVASLPAQVVLPGHGEPFTDLASRTTEIAEHHEERAAKIVQLLNDHPQNAYQVTMQLFDSRRINSNEARRMAVAEVLSHLEYMRYNGQVVQEQTKEGILYAVR